MLPSQSLSHSKISPPSSAESVVGYLLEIIGWYAPCPCQPVLVQVLITCGWGGGDDCQGKDLLIIYRDRTGDLLTRKGKGGRFMETFRVYIHTSRTNRLLPMRGLQLFSRYSIFTYKYLSTTPPLPLPTPNKTQNKTRKKVL